MTPTERPHLVAVDGEAGATENPTPTPAPAAERRFGGPLVWALAVALIVCAVGWALAARSNRALEVTLLATQTRLQDAQARVSAYETYLASVRDRFDSVETRVRRALDLVAGELGALDTLLEQEPTEPTPE